MQTGADSDSLFDGLTYVDGSLRAHNLEPQQGYAGGGDQVSIHGAGFTPSTQIHFGTAAAGAAVFRSAELIEVTTPIGVAGAVDVHLSDGSRATTIPAGFVYSAERLVVDRVAPDAGGVGGGTEVHVYGRGFTADTRVFFGRLEARDVDVHSHAHLIAIAPPSTAGTVDLKVVVGDHASTLPAAWTFADAVGGSGPDERPYITHVRGVSPTQIAIAFSVAMGASARDPANYSITGDGSPGSRVPILRLSSGNQSASNTWLYFDTGEQDAQTYTLSAHGVTSSTGLPFAAPEIVADGQIVRYNQSTFWGQRPESPSDADGDGIYDVDERTGWVIRVTAFNGQVSEAAGATATPGRRRCITSSCSEPAPCRQSRQPGPQGSGSRLVR